MVPVDSFTHGPATPLVAYLVAVLGSALGLRCTMRALHLEREERIGWLGLGAVAIGAGVFTMHCVAMMGFSAQGVHIEYDVLTTCAGLGVAVLVVGAGVFVVGYRECTPGSLAAGGTLTGLGLAGMHFLGMTAMDMTAEVFYDPALVALSLVIGVVVATAALWCVVSTRLFGAAIGAAMVMGVAVTGMHYTAMEAMSVHDRTPGDFVGDTSAVGTFLPVLVAPFLLLLLVALFLGLDPMMERDSRREWGTRPGEQTGEKLEWTPFEHR